MSWARRFEENDAVHMVDESLSTLPVVLQFDEVTMQLPVITLNTLLLSWHQVNGMVAALTTPGICLCVPPLGSLLSKP